MAVFPVAAGSTDFDASGYIPEVWSPLVVRNLYDNLLMGVFANTEWEGEIQRAGSTVKIRTTPRVTIRNWVKNQHIQTETPTGSTMDLLINKGKYFATFLDDVDVQQQDIPLEEKYAADAGSRIRIAIDEDVLSRRVTKAHARNTGANAGAKSGRYAFGTSGGPIPISRTMEDNAGTPRETMATQLINAMAAMDEQNAMTDDVYVALWPVVGTMFNKGDLTEASWAGDVTSIQRTGAIGQIAGATVYKTNLLPSYGSGVDTSYPYIWGDKYGYTFAGTVTKTERIRTEGAFGGMLRGLMIYGDREVKPEVLGTGYVKMTAAVLK